jgi:hypothetical protein
MMGDDGKVGWVILDSDRAREQDGDGDQPQTLPSKLRVRGG